MGAGTPCQIDVKLAKIEGRKNATQTDRNGQTYKAPVFMVSQIPKMLKIFDIGRRGCQRSNHDKPPEEQEIGAFGH